MRIGGEATKSGFEPQALLESISELAGLSSIAIQGLMTIPPPVSNPDEARPYFSATRHLRDQLATESGLSLPQLSMGMSGDYQVAISEGSTMVRVGSAIFGSREKTF